MNITVGLLHIMQRYVLKSVPYCTQCVLNNLSKKVESTVSYLIMLMFSNPVNFCIIIFSIYKLASSSKKLDFFLVIFVSLKSCKELCHYIYYNTGNIFIEHIVNSILQIQFM